MTEELKHKAIHGTTEHERITALADWLDQQPAESGMLSMAAATLRDYLGKVAAPRSNLEIIEQTNELAGAFYEYHGYRHRTDFRYDKSTHPQERLMFELACIAQRELTDTDPRDALDELEGGADD